MENLILFEQFTRPEFDSRLTWFNPPPAHRIQNGKLIVQTAAKSDFWQRTHYGFQADNGHFLNLPVTGDFLLTTHVRFFPKNQYDQAGLLIYLSPDCWLKTSVEFEPHEPNKLGVVVTNFGYSDWSTQNFEDPKNEISLRVRRTGSDATVEFAAGVNQAEWHQLRLAHLHEQKSTIQAGIYACSPIEAGYAVEFYFIKIEKI